MQSTRYRATKGCKAGHNILLPRRDLYLTATLPTRKSSGSKSSSCLIGKLFNETLSPKMVGLHSAPPRTGSHKSAIHQSSNGFQPPQQALLRVHARACGTGHIKDTTPSHLSTSTSAFKQRIFFPCLTCVRTPPHGTEMNLIF
jgi:hypothetical protein